MPSKKYIILFSLVLAELLMITYCKNIFGSIVSPLFQFLISLSIGITSVIFYKDIIDSEKNISTNSFSKQNIFLILFFIAAVILFFFIPKGGLVGIYREFKINAGVSDVIPAIQVMCKRFVNGEEVYQYIDNFGYQMAPSYLPMVWLPYIPAEMLHADYRYTMVFIWTVVSILLLLTGFKKNNFIKNSVGVLLAGFFLFSIIDKEPAALGWTPELVNASFYVLLLIGILSNNRYLKSLVIVLCLLSRYSIVLFLPVIFLIEWKEKGWKENLLLLCCTSILLLSILLPLGKHHWKDLYQGYEHYSISGIAEWKHLRPNGLPWHILNGNGFAAWMYTFKSGSIEERFFLMQKIHLVLVTTTVIVLLLVYFFQKTTIDYKWYTVCAIKIYLTVFYSFIQVPYTYLFLVPVMYSIAMLVMMNKETQPLKSIEI